METPNPTAVPTVTIETITPDRAAEYLATVDRQRPLSKRSVDRYADLIREDLWMLSCDAIGFDRDGNNVNGQHRLSAVVAAGKAAPFVVIRGLDPDVFEVLDSGTARSGGDVLAVLGYAHYNTLAAIARVWCGYVEAGRLAPSVTNCGVENAEIREAVEAYPHLMESAAFAVRHAKSVSGIIPGSILGFCHAVYTAPGGPDRAVVDRFFESLATGFGLSAGQPVAALRQMLVNSAAAAHATITRPSMVALVVVAMNKTLAGRSVKMIRYSPTTQDYPQPALAA